MVVLAFAESVQILPDFALVVHVFFILIMIWVLNRTFFRPINRVISARDTGKGGQMSDADKMLQSAADKEQQYKDRLLAARNEGYELIEAERIDAVQARQQKVSAAKAETAAKVGADLEELDELTESARKVIADKAVKLADEISSKIVKAA
jgi:F-type H+-transporting ATPase subunit b